MKRAHPQPGVDLTYIKQGAEANGDGGDQYTGLDRFGRVVNQRWIVVSNGTHTDRFGYGYDRNSNRLYRENLLPGVAATFSEVYQTPTRAYDLLNQLQDFARGTLNGAKNDVTENPAPRRQSWAFDALGRKKRDGHVARGLGRQPILVQFRRCFMADKPILHQPYQRRQFGFVSLGELAGAIWYEVASHQPQNPYCPKGEWYCQNPECIVREVTVSCKLWREVFPTIKCPACRKPLKFHHWLRTETLVPYKEDTASA